MSLQPTDEQSEAIENIEAWFSEAKSDFTYKHHAWKGSDEGGWKRGGEFLLDGGAGTGKSTTASFAVQALNLKKVVFGAYTAKAARVMQSKGMEGAATLHSLLYRPEHRAAAESPITRLAWSVRRGSPLIVGGPPEARVAPLGANAWSEILNRDNQVLCGKHKTRETVIRRAREQFGFRGLPQPGEPLVCTKNNYRQGLINGDIAIMWRVTEDDLNANWYEATLLIDGEERPDIKIIRPSVNEILGDSRSRQLACFDFAYAITVHKMQGSEADSVVVIDDKFAQWDRDLRRRWLYTALTRASERVQVFTTG